MSINKIPSVFIAALTLSLVGCAAQMVSAPGSGASPYAPVNEASRGGMIRFLNAGAESVRKQRREDAYRQMSLACNGKYRLDSEGPRSEGGSVTRIGASAFFEQSEFWYIQFSCLP